MIGKQQTIENLLPHRTPFLFVDDIVSVDKEEIVAVKTFDSETNLWLKGSFPEHNFVPGTILIESMAQCGGAAIKQMGIMDGLFALTSIEHAEFFKGVEYDQPVKYVIKNIRISDKLIKQSGIAYVNELLALEATWLCVRMG
ncbi:beta-hydroxyacyl-ACP dehydratase [uncultured Imperialibacter sp.]|uniref:3-hydroxyacyl-ACP dehydratase FabZ family protein n=1 Tax=uncultured Imperialibacter sp. TaxID=1672639 RepID=UPI0030DBD1CE|tara:strand:- start:71306 stop:71731 length:426 start_codon:yes stop_codon:yes gene_type:complete